MREEYSPRIGNSDDTIEHWILLFYFLYYGGCFLIYTDFSRPDWPYWQNLLDKRMIWFYGLFAGFFAGSLSTGSRTLFLIFFIRFGFSMLSLLIQGLRTEKPDEHRAHKPRCRKPMKPYRLNRKNN